MPVAAHKRDLTRLQGCGDRSAVELQKYRQLTPVWRIDMGPGLPISSAARRNQKRRGYTMASLDLIDLLARANENLGIEFKAWMDTRILRATITGSCACAWRGLRKK